MSVSANWLWNFFVVMITPTLIEDLAWKGYLIFMALNFVFVPVCLLSFILSDDSSFWFVVFVKVLIGWW